MYLARTSSITIVVPGRHHQSLALACRENREDFEGFLGEEFDAYTNSMAQVGTWGDELTLVSIRRAHGRQAILSVGIWTAAGLDFRLAHNLRRI